MFFEHPQVHFCRVYVARGFPFFLQTAREKKETKLKMHRDKWTADHLHIFLWGGGGLSLEPLLSHLVCSLQCLGRSCPKHLYLVALILLPSLLPLCF